METRMKQLLAAMIIGWCTLGTASALPPENGPQGKHRGPPPPHEVIRKHADELGIDQDTVDQVVDIAEDAKDDMRSLHAKIRQESRALHTLLSADSPNETTVFQQVDRLKAAEAAQQKRQLAVLMDIRALLTPEQLDAIKALHQRMRQHHNGPRHTRPGMGEHPPGHRGPPPGPRGPR